MATRRVLFSATAVFVVASLLPGRVAAQGSPGDKCSICEYVMESVDRAVK